MSLPSIELMTLGALKDHPMSAYDINKFLASRGVSNWVQVSEQSVYRIAIKLCNDGYTSIDTEDSANPKASSQKRVYSITSKGVQHFDELMNEIASAPPHITFDFVAMVANLYQTDETTGRRLLTTLETNHRSVAEWLRNSVADLPFSEASETVLLCADTYALIARRAHHFQENFYNDSVSTDTDEPNNDNDNDTQNSPTVIVKNQRFTGSLPITKLDFHLHSMAGRITTQPSESGAFEIKFHHCKASDFQIANTAGTLHIANTGTPWNHMSLTDIFNPAQWNAYVEVIIPTSQPLAQTTAVIESAGFVIAGLDSRNFDLNLHSSSAKINDISVDAASLTTHGGSMKWYGTVHNILNMDSHSSSARISGLPRNFGYRAEIHSSSLTVGDQPIIASRHSASRSGTPMVDLNLHSSSIALD
ncbi:MAG: PadR family transcriptional regulator [Bifidobacterium sp.]|nr:PadR family transcriptional regulator [Bifidobacterium sp.]